MKKIIGTAILTLFSISAGAQTDRPNFLIIWGDDIGWYNISAFNHGVMGYRTPNIDRIASAGMMFTDWYGQQSCTAGRAAFITGQSPMRTGLTKVGLPGALEGMQIEDPTIPGLLKNYGYATGQFGKNHLGDRDVHLPTNHGFDEFFGNLYHLNAEDEPENADYPGDFVLADGSLFRDRFGPRGVISATADGDIEDTGPLTMLRMETVDEETTARALNFMERTVAANQPFFLWWNSTRMHVWTRLKAESQGVTGLGIYADGMVEHDGHVGQLLDKLDELGIADNTLVMYSTDNGAEVFTWPDGGTTPFRGEKNTNWEGGYRVPTIIRWPGVIEPGSVSNEIFSHEDMLPTILAAAGDTDIKERLLQGNVQAIGRNYNVHLDGYNMLPYLRGETDQGPRSEFLYWTDDGDIAALRYNNWKIVFMEQRAHGFNVWQDPFVVLRFPKLFNLRMDPFELADQVGMGYGQWRAERMFAIAPAITYIGGFLQTFVEYPPRQTPGSFNLGDAMDKIMQGSPNN